MARRCVCSSSVGSSFAGTVWHRHNRTFGHMGGICPIVGLEHTAREVLQEKIFAACSTRVPSTSFGDCHKGGETFRADQSRAASLGNTKHYRPGTHIQQLPCPRGGRRGQSCARRRGRRPFGVEGTDGSSTTTQHLVLHERYCVSGEIRSQTPHVQVFDLHA